MSHKHGQTADVLKKNSLGWETCKAYGIGEEWCFYG
jgi:hypothetical protein